MNRILLAFALCLVLFALPTFAQDSTRTLVDNLSSLSELHERGIISDDEFNAAKRRLLGLPVKTKERVDPEANRIPIAVDSEESEQMGERRISVECLAVFEEDINFVRERSAIFNTYRLRILAHSLSALAGGTDGKNPAREDAIAKELTAERNRKTNQISNQRDSLLYENTHCFDL